LDISLLGLCWHNKTLLPAKLPQCLISWLATSHNISWRLVRDCRDTVSYHPPCHQGESPQTAGRRSHQVPIDSLSQRRIPPPSDLGRALDAQWNPVRSRNQQGEGITTHRTGKKPGSNSGLPQEAEGETDHLPETVSNRLLG
jgi:hypothetical protein